MSSNGFVNLTTEFADFLSNIKALIENFSLYLMLNKANLSEYSLVSL